MREPKAQSHPEAKTPAASPGAEAPEAARMTDKTEVNHAPAVQPRTALHTPGEGTKSSAAQGLMRGVRPGVGGLAARTAMATTALPQARLGRSPASVIATLNRALAGVDMRLVNLLMHPRPQAPAPDDGTRLELALLARMHQTIVGQSEQMQDDAVLIDSLAEFADAVGATVADLEAGGTRALDRWLDFVREQTATLGALGAQTEAPKKSIRALRQAMVPLRELHKVPTTLPAEARAKLKGFRAKVIVLFDQTAAALEEASPTPDANYLDAVWRLPPAPR